MNEKRVDENATGHKPFSRVYYGFINPFINPPKRVYSGVYE